MRPRLRVFDLCTHEKWLKPDGVSPRRRCGQLSVSGRLNDMQRFLGWVVMPIAAGHGHLAGDGGLTGNVWLVTTVLLAMKF